MAQSVALDQWLGVALLVGLGVVAPIVDPAGIDKYHFEYAVWPMMLGFCCEHWKAWVVRLPGATLLTLAGLVVSGASIALMPLGIETKELVIAGGSVALLPCLFAYLLGHPVAGRAGGFLTWLGRRTYSIYLWQQPLRSAATCPRYFTRQTGSMALVGAGVLAAFLAFPAVAAAPQELIVFARTVGNRQELFSIRPDGSALQRLTPGGANEGEPVLSPDGRLIAAVGDGGIVIRARDGSLVRRIHVRAGSEVSDPTWSPGGRWIAYLAEQCQNDDGRDLGPLCADLWLVRPNGRVRRRLVEADVSTNDLVARYAWSPTGRSIVFERFEKASLAIVDVGTGRIGTLRGTRRFGSDPDWSRSGWIVFARQRGPFKGSDLYAVRPTGRGLRRLCKAENAERPVSSKDGKQIAFLDYRPTLEGNLWHVRIAGTDGAHCRQVGAATEEWTLTWSPDGARLLWENWDERLVIARADGRGSPRPLARGTVADWR